MFDFKFHKEAEKELGKLDKTIQNLFIKKLKQILANPEIGFDLGHRHNLNLSGLKKVYFDNKRYRIVYKVFENELVIYLISIGKRDNLDVYKKAVKRI